MGDEVRQVDPGTRRFAWIAGALIFLATAASLAEFAYTFTAGPVRGHGAIVGDFLLTVFGIAGLLFAAAIGWLASNAGKEHLLMRKSFRMVSILSLVGAAGWVVWFLAMAG